MSDEYANGVKEFIRFVIIGNSNDLIKCPSVRCCVKRIKSRDHFFIQGVHKGYTQWMAW